MKYIIILLTLLLFTNTCYSQDITYVKKGDVVAQDGFFISADQMKKFREINELLKLEQQKSLKLSDLQVIQEEKVVLYKSQAEEYQKAYSWSETKSFWKSAGFFALGVVLTGVTSYATIKTLR